MRQKFAAAINRDALVQRLLKSKGRPASSIIPSGIQALSNRVALDIAPSSTTRTGYMVNCYHCLSGGVCLTGDPARLILGQRASAETWNSSVARPASTSPSSPNMSVF